MRACAMTRKDGDQDKPSTFMSHLRNMFRKFRRAQSAATSTAKKEGLTRQMELNDGHRYGQFGRLAYIDFGISSNLAMMFDERVERKPSCLVGWCYDRVTINVAFTRTLRVQHSICT